MKSGKQCQSKRNPRKSKTNAGTLLFLFLILGFAVIISASGFIFNNKSSKTNAAVREQNNTPTPTPTPITQTNNSEGEISPEALRQIQALLQEKESRTPAQMKIDSRLLYTIKMERGEMLVVGVPTLRTGLTVDEKGYIDVDIVAHVTANLLEELKRINAEIIVSLPQYRSITAHLPLTAIESLAEMDEIIFIMPKQETMLSQAPETPAKSSDFKSNGVMKTNLFSRFEERANQVHSFISSSIYDDSQPETGSATSQGDTTHRANTFRSTTGFNGTGIKIGVLSDGINSLAARQATGDLPANVTVLPGQAGIGDEGTAMLEIVNDIAPGAQLFFATATLSSAQFAQNIRDLRTAGCDIIIDDIAYLVETPFQNGQAANVVSSTNSGVVIQAVNDVTAAGALYFAAAGNSGNKNDGTAGAWEGDFVDGGAVAPPITGSGNLHNFGGSTFNTLTSSARCLEIFPTLRRCTVFLKWSDPLGASSNDYDLFILNSTGTTVSATSTNPQTGTQDPVEVQGIFANERVVIVKRTGAAGRFLHLNTNQGRLSISTSGVVFGHSGGLNTISIAATPSGPAQNNTAIGPFPNAHSSSNTVENFSSDGPRRIFYNADSTAITPGNVSSSGGQLLQKPDITAADGVTTTTPGFIPFFGTSAAAPHAGALAALLKSACPASTNTQLINAMRTTAIDIEVAGIDRDSGTGIFMPIPARQALCGGGPTPTPTPTPTATPTPTPTPTATPTPTPTISINDVSLNEGNSGTTNFTFNVTLSAASTQTVTVSFATADGTATASSGDYVANAGTVTFNPNETSRPITVLVNGDTVVESNETFFINLSNPVNATIADSQGLGTIVNDDGCSYSINPTSQSFTASSGTGSINVITQAGCAWTATSNSLPSFVDNLNNFTNKKNAMQEIIDSVVSPQAVFSNTTPIAVPATGTSGVGNPFPSNITVSGMTGTVTDVNVKINQFTHTFPDDVAFLLVSPDGRKFVLQSDVGGGTDIVNLTYTLDDQAVAGIPDSGPMPPNNGSAKPSSVGDDDGMPPPAPPIPYQQPAPAGTATLNGTFGGINPNGTWSLFIVDFFAGDEGDINGGWTLEITTQVGATNWITITSGQSGNGNGTVSYTVAQNATGLPRTGTMTIAGQTFTVNQSNTQTRRTPFDFDGDGKSDISIFRPSVGEWWYLRSSGGNRAFQFGNSSDRITPGDFTGDGLTDIAFWRPSTGEWFVLRSEDGSFYSFPFGSPGDIPVPADYDADGRTDAAVFRPSNLNWYISLSGGGVIIQQYGAAGDKPVAADYDGDGRADLAIYRPAGGEWWILRSTAGLIVLQFGNSQDRPVQGDYTGDGKADVAVFRPSTNTWFILRSENFSFYSFPFGTAGDVVSPGDYDGDGRFDASIFRPSTNTWYVDRTTAGILIQNFGANGDRSVPNAFVPQ